MPITSLDAKKINHPQTDRQPVDPGSVVADGATGPPP